MGLTASQARFLLLTAKKSDSEMKRQSIGQMRLALANQLNMLFNHQTNLDPNSQQAQQLQQKINALHTLDKKLELQLDQLKKAFTVELEAIQKVIDKNIDLSFKTFV